MLVHARRKLLRAEVTLEHREHLAAFLISDLVEGAGDLAVVRDRLANRPALAERVGIHRGEGLLELACSDAEIGSPLVADLLAHPLREALVEPDVSPPRWRDEVAEPLV